MRGIETNGGRADNQALERLLCKVAAGQPHSFSSLLTARQVKQKRHPCPRLSRLLEPGREVCVRREMDHDFG